MPASCQLLPALANAGASLCFAKVHLARSQHVHNTLKYLFPVYCLGTASQCPLLPLVSFCQSCASACMRQHLPAVATLQKACPRKCCKQKHPGAFIPVSASCVCRRCKWQQLQGSRCAWAIAEAMSTVSLVQMWPPLWPSSACSTVWRPGRRAA